MAKDIENTEDGDWLFVPGVGMVFTDTPEERLIQKLCDMNKGGNRQSPMSGIGIRKTINAETNQDIVKSIYQELERDVVWSEEEVSISGKEIFINAKHK